MTGKYKTSVTDFGGDGKVIILLHGFLSSSRYWKKLQPYLSSAGYRVITIDLLGFGKAPKPHESDYSYDTHISYLHTTIKDLGLSAPFTLTGHSMGALLAARYGRLHSDKVSTLVLLHPPLYRDMAEAYATLRETNKLYKFLLDSHYRRVGWIVIKTFTGYHTHNHSRTAREKSLQNVIEKAEIFDDLKSLTIRTLLIVGLKDRRQYLDNLSRHSLSDSIVIAKENVAHHSPVRDTELIQEKILRFIAQRDD